MLQRRTQEELWRLARVKLGELEDHVEYSALVRRSFGAPNVNVPDVHEFFIGNCRDSDERNLRVFKLLKVFGQPFEIEGL